MKRLGLLILLVTAACADEIPEDVSAQMEAARTASETAVDTAAGTDVEELLVSAPPGGHTTWIRDIRTGLDSVTAKAAVDRGEALHAVQELYSRRFEPLLRFYGPGGAHDAGSEMALTVERAGVHLQTLMQHLASDAADPLLIDQAVLASHDALQQVEDASRDAGLDPAAPRDAITTGS